MARRFSGSASPGPAVGLEGRPPLGSGVKVSLPPRRSVTLAAATEGCQRSLLVHCLPASRRSVSDERSTRKLNCGLGSHSFRTAEMPAFQHLHGESHTSQKLCW